MMVKYAKIKNLNDKICENKTRMLKLQNNKS